MDEYSMGNYDKLTKFKENMNTLIYNIKMKRRKIITDSIIVILCICVFAAPYLLAFSPMMLGPQKIELQDPYPYIDYKIWEEGSQNKSTSDFQVSLSLLSADIGESKLFSVYSSIKAPIINDSTIIGHEYEDETFEIELNHMYGNEIGEFNNYSDWVGYDAAGLIQNFPFDEYYIRFRFHNLYEINISEQEQVFFQIRSLDSSWKIQRFKAYLTFEESKTYFDLGFRIGRQPNAIFHELLIPVIILSGIFTITLITNPSKEFPNESDENYQSIEKKIDQNRKFRIDTAKWILAFSFANILLYEQKILTFTVKSMVSLSALTLTSIFYLSSKNQGGKWGELNTLLGLSAGTTVIGAISFFLLNSFF